ncbi:MAG: YeeE/YedE family protein [Leptospiraceae bacterium]|nr:YeeE/YedE family protein [Leptospiraceae bacterium]MCP5513325.1 YeeE/YedE family protein [Leptospiraceae bacterium]
MAPFDLVGSLGKFWGYSVFFLIGIGFGAVLEMSGFGDSRKLAAQFYFKEMRVLKVMFTAIIVALVLIFLSTSFGLLDFRNLYVNPTYLMPGILGGLIMGVGFIMGGFCPGTSLVATSTFKLDGLLFFLGVITGVGVFGETVSSYHPFYERDVMERFLLSDYFNTSIGVMVLVLVLIALTMFYGAEISEKIFGKNQSIEEIDFMPKNKKYIAAALSLLFIAGVILFRGQPDPSEKWKYASKKYQSILEKREIYIHPGEMRELMNERTVFTRIMDLRPEKDFNLFHLRDSFRVTEANLNDPHFVDTLLSNNSETVYVLLSNEEAIATEAWKILRAQGVINLYILEGGMNNWLEFFPLPEEVAIKKVQSAPESLHYQFFRAVGAQISASHPEESHGEEHAIEFTKKVKMQKKKAVMGGCG